VSASDPTQSAAGAARGAAAPLAILHVDLEALAANHAWLQAAAAPARVGAVVKADGYGLGAVPVARRLAAAGCTDFFVATYAEAVELRPEIPEGTLYVLGGCLPGGTDDFLRQRLVPVLNTADEVRDWARTASGAPAAVQLDTGMNRRGLDAGDVAALERDHDVLPRLNLVLVLTHYACADDATQPLNAAQVERFEALRARLPAAPTSIANTAGTLLGPEFRGDVIRPGLGLYGGRAAAHGPNPMREVARLQARVLQLRDVREAGTVGYGATHTVRPPARLATLGIGYADGYLRSLSGRGIVVAAGHRVPVVGRVSMDLLTVDVTTVPRHALTVGDWVDVIGGGIALEEVAALAGTIPYELLTAIGPRVARSYR
jgi:alanine racemase